MLNSSPHWGIETSVDTLHYHESHNLKVGSLSMVGFTWSENNVSNLFNFMLLLCPVEPAFVHCEFSVFLFLYYLLNWLKIHFTFQAKPFQFMPGHGMSIEVTLFGEEKPYLFSGLVGRDNICREIQLAIEEARKGNTDAVDAPPKAETKPPVEEPGAGRGETDMFT